MRHLSRIVASVLVLALASPVGAEVSEEDLARARAAVDELLAGSEELGRQVQEAWGRQFALEDEIADLTASIELTRIRLGEAERELESAAVEMYVGSASAASIHVLFTASSEEAYGVGMEYLRRVSGDTAALIDQLTSFREELDRYGRRLVEATEEQAVLLADLEADAGQLEEELIQAQAEYERLVAQAAEEAAQREAEEEARRQAEAAAATSTTTTATTTTVPVITTTVPVIITSTTTVPEATTTTVPEPTTTPPPPPPTSGEGTCPVAGAVSFTDTWGAPRSGGRSHQGVDMIAARNTPIVAVRDGTISRITNGALSGLAVWLRASNGDLFFYAHMESYGDITTGQSVPAGYVIGYNGSSGNSPSYLPHLHFEYHPGGGAAVNPYPLVRSIC